MKDVAEHKSNAPLWTHTKGIYADLSNHPKSVDYYVKCPKCGHVHGNFTSIRQAFDHRHCSACHFDQIEQIKKEVAKSSKNLREAEDVPERDVEAELSDFLGQDIDSIMSEDVVVVNWNIDAISRLNQETGYEFELAAYEDPAEEDPDSREKVDVTDGGADWTIWRTEDDAVAAATRQVEDSLRSEPDNFTASWLMHFVDEEKLLRWIGDPYEDWEEMEYGDLDYTERLERLVDADEIEDDDPRFFGEIENEFDPEDGPVFGQLPETPERSGAVDELITELAEKTKPETDPVEYLKDTYGDKWMEQVKDAGAIDTEKAAEDAVSTDGWAHFLNSYDGGYTTLAGGYVAHRTN